MQISTRDTGARPWQCPLCGTSLEPDLNHQGPGGWRCAQGHSFDCAKEGYCHLLPVQAMRTKAPGDSKEMVAARREFLGAGYYDLFGEALARLCLAYGAPSQAAPNASLHLLDAGCGEGWYDRCVAAAFAEQGRALELAGFDIAKPAVRLAAKALPGAEHLYGMKAVLYDAPYKNPVQQVEYEGFAAIGEREVTGTITVPREHLGALFAMTPYYWKTPRGGAERLAALDSLTTAISFRFLVFEKK
jgi:23S rRNA (guanine745-N1)-methyltransferase